MEISDDDYAGSHHPSRPTQSTINIGNYDLTFYGQSIEEKILKVRSNGRPVFGFITQEATLPNTQ